MNSSGDAIIGKTLDGVITNWNESAQRLFGYSAREAIGESMSMLLPPGSKAERTRPRPHGPRRRGQRSQTDLFSGRRHQHPQKLPRLAEVVLPDLAITGTASETFAVKVVGYGAGLALLGPALWAAMRVVGVHLGFEFPAVAVRVLGVTRVVTPFVDLHTAAQRRRRHFCHSLSTYASLVSMAMAGAMGWSSALEVAAGVSRCDWAMTEIAQALLWAEAYRKPPWEGLDRLATTFNLPDLADLARSMAQAGDGARIRDSLEAKASSLRLKETAALEDAAAATTQKMLLPGVLLMAGYGVLVFYPALAAFTGAHI